MKARARFLIGAWTLAAMCFSICAFTAGAATIAGIVRDAAAKPVAGVRIKLVTESGVMTEQTTSGKDGAYRFEQIAAGTYRLTVDNVEFRSPAATTVTLSTATASVVADFAIEAVPNDDLKPAASAPPPKFEAAGVRGLIDPGGYSAPANAAAASGLISGIADIKRVDNVLPMAADLPCSLELDLKKAAEANPQRAAANRRLGEFYLVHGQGAQAIPYLERGRQIDNSDGATARDLANALLMTGQFDAVRQLAAALPASQWDAGMHRLLARAEEGLGRFTDASKEYHIAAELEPNDQNLFGVGYELILAGLPADASKAFAAGVARYPHSMMLLIGAGTAEFLLGRSSDAVSLLLQAADAAPSDPRPYSFLATASGISGAQFEQVLARLKRYVDIAPNDANAYYFYALGLSAPGKERGDVDNSRTEALFKQAIALDPSLADAHFRLGTVYAERNAFDSAALEFEATLRLLPDSKEAHYRLAALYRKTGRTAQAAHEMQLFSEYREAQTSKDGGISIEQLAPAVNHSGSETGQQTQCPAASQLR